MCGKFDLAHHVLGGFTFITAFRQNINCGLSVSHTNPEEIAEEIKKIKMLSSDRYSEMCKNARCAAEQFDISLLAKKYLEEISCVITKYNLIEEKKND